MKKLACLFALCALLTACGGNAPAHDPAVHNLTAEACAQAVLVAGSFSETLEPIETSVAAALYGLDEASILDCAAYLSTGATAEECVFLMVAEPEDVTAVRENFLRRVREQTEALTDYQPKEIPKLEAASIGTFTTTAGEMVYLVVSCAELDLPSLLIK